MLSLTIQLGHQDIDQFEKLLLVHLLGVLDAVEQDLMTTIDAERYLLNSFRNAQLTTLGVRADILDVLEQAGFLDDAKRLGATSFASSCRDLRVAVLQALRIRASNNFAAALTFQLEIY
ncbi:DUF3969 family protein [Deinococcus navajonensis]|uniref:DUF3969 family protein n=1 Tax=Deinococcus navajonensis TaxID=309884 RepID=A0ABV8XJH8_9DEIO